MRRRKRRGSCTPAKPSGGEASVSKRSFAAAVIEPVEPRVMLAADLVISEFLAANTRTLADRDGDFTDWIEIHNRGDAFADLSGWHLTDQDDQLDQWAFPAGVGLAPGAYLIVFASEKPPVAGSTELHAGFKLEKSGEYLALVRPDAITIEFEYPFPYPAQTDDVSYGLARPNAPEDEFAFFSTPTPGAANPSTTPSSTLSPVISEPSRTFSGSITVSLATSSPSPNAQIRYTTNGSTPVSSSPVYTGPLTLSANTLLRARVFEPGKNPGPVVTRTYVAMAPDVRTFDSNLPVVVLDTFGQGLSDTNLRGIGAYVIDTNPLDGRARMVDLPQYSGRSGLRYRGQSSQGFPKRPYAFETWDENGDDKSVPLLGMPAESDWVLYNPYSEKSLLQNHLAYTWSNAMGRYASRTRFVEVFLNTSANGTLDYADYIGIYILEEKIKRDENRVDVAPLGPEDNAGNDVTGGYIFKIDKLDSGEQYFRTNRGQAFLHVEPEVFELTSQQQNYLYGYLNAFEAALYGPNFTDPLLGYQAYIDVDSWIDHHIMVEMTKNIDGFRISTYFHKDRGGKIAMGPIWDYNLSMGNANYNGGQNATGWYHNNISAGEYPYWRRLFEDPNFQQRYTDRWQELRRDVFRTERLMADIDAATRLLSDGTNNYPVGQYPTQIPNNALVRNFQRWNVLGQPLWPNAVWHEAYYDEVGRVKSFMSDRLNWIDSQYVAAPTASHAGGKMTGPVQLSLTGASGATIYYTTDGSDPRLSGGGISPSAIRYTGPIAIDKTTRVRARAFSFSRWSGVTDRSFVYDQGLRITEVMYHPHDPPAGSAREEGAYEYVELHNAGAQPINLGGHRFDNGITYTFPAGFVIEPGERRVLVSDATAFAERYPGVTIDGIYAGRLDNNGERVRLVNAAGVAIIEFRYGDGGAWPGRADGGASSLEPIDAGGDLNDPKNWRSSIDYAGSPRAAGAAAIDVVINELLTRTTAPVVDSIELYNPTDARINVSGWYLSDAQSNYAKFRIPDDTFIEARGYLVFDEHDFNPTPENPLPHHFALDGVNGDDLWLVRADPDGRLRAFVDSVHFAGGAAGDGVTLGRSPNGTGRLRPLLAPSLGAPNGSAAAGEVLISELVYNHSSKKEVAEFVELHNMTPDAIDLSGWRFDGGIDYVIPAGTILPGLGELIVVPFDPLDPREAPRLSLFRSTYGLSTSAPLVGGFDGRLDNAGDTIRLVRPAPSLPGEPGTAVYVAVDEVEYEPADPWPTRADGGGSSLVRVNPLGDGRDVGAWSAPFPTPGAHGFSSLTIGGSDEDEVYDVRLAADGTHVRVSYGRPRSAPSRVYAFEIGGVNTLALEVGAGNDRLTIDLSSVVLPSPLKLDLGGIGAADADFLSVAGPLQLTILATHELTDLSVTSGARVTLAPGVSINTDNLHVSGGGVLDIGTGRVVVREGSLREINDTVASGRNGGLTRWGGPGITSNAVLVHDLTSVGIHQAGDGVHVAWALHGDVNLDGRVNADDYFQIDRGFLSKPADPMYRDGDFNYNGRINADDYFLIDTAFLGQASFPGGASGAAEVAAKPLAAMPAVFSTTSVSTKRRSRSAAATRAGGGSGGEEILTRSIRRPAGQAAPVRK